MKNQRPLEDRQFGVYYILNKVNSRVYIGQSTDVPERIRGHQKALRSGHHPCADLQHDWDTYNENAFEFGVLVTVPWQQHLSPTLGLVALEKTFIHLYQSDDPNFGYNIRRGPYKYKEAKETLEQRLNREANAAAIKYRPQ